MNVARAKEHIQRIDALCKEINDFDATHIELMDKLGFLCDVIGYLKDYKDVLIRGIENAELSI